VLDRLTLVHRRLLIVVGVLLLATLVGMVLLWPTADRLPETEEPPEPLVSATVLDVERYTEDVDPDLGISGERAIIVLEVEEGPDAGRILELDQHLDGFPPISAGDRVELTPAGTPDGEREYYISDFQRLPVLGILLAIFIAAVLLIGRWHGLRSLLGLGLAMAVVVQFIVPAILAGQNPPLVALVGSVAIMIVTLYLTHGLNEMTTSAAIGTSLALIVTVGLGMGFISLGKITGFASEQAVFAQFAVEGLDLRGLVLAGLIIAALGVLDDVTISQSSTVFALHDTDRRLPWAVLFARAMKVGRDHIAAVVNTLFLVYAGASLALLVLFSTGGLPVSEILNSEIIAEEFIKIIVGSLGLIAAVPITTALAALVAIHRPADAPPLGGGHTHGPIAPSRAESHGPTADPSGSAGS
jgi:uncharacterized membrane protein